MRTVVETPTYLKAASTLFNDAERSEIVTAIASDPETGDRMAGTGGYRKWCFRRGGMGKRGGARIVYLLGSSGLPIFLITAYEKAEKGNLSKGNRTRSRRGRRASSPSTGGNHEQAI